METRPRALNLITSVFTPDIRCSDTITVFLIAKPSLTLPAELVHLVVNHFLDAAAVCHPGVMVEGLESLAGAVGLGVGFAVLAVGRGAGVAALGVLPGGERAVGSTFLHFHGCLSTSNVGHEAKF